LITIKPPLDDKAPTLVSTVKLPAATGCGAAPEVAASELQLVAIPTTQAGIKTVAAPNPTFAKKSFLVMIVVFYWFLLIMYEQNELLVF
jgi:hypothetical protein